MRSEFQSAGYFILLFRVIYPLAVFKFFQGEPAEKAGDPLFYSFKSFDMSFGARA